MSSISTDYVRTALNSLMLALDGGVSFADTVPDHEQLLRSWPLKVYKGSEFPGEVSYESYLFSGSTRALLKVAGLATPSDVIDTMLNAISDDPVEFFDALQESFRSALWEEAKSLVTVFVDLLQFIFDSESDRTAAEWIAENLVNPPPPVVLARDALNLLDAEWKAWSDVGFDLTYLAETYWDFTRAIAPAVARMDLGPIVTGFVSSPRKLGEFTGQVAAVLAFELLLTATAMGAILGVFSKSKRLRNLSSAMMKVQEALGKVPLNSKLFDEWQRWADARRATRALRVSGAIRAEIVGEAWKRLTLLLDGTGLSYKELTAVAREFNRNMAALVLLDPNPGTGGKFNLAKLQQLSVKVEVHHFIEDHTRKISHYQAGFQKLVTWSEQQGRKSGKKWMWQEEADMPGVVLFQEFHTSAPETLQKLMIMSDGGEPLTTRSLTTLLNREIPDRAAFPNLLALVEKYEEVYKSKVPRLWLRIAADIDEIKQVLKAP